MRVPTRIGRYEVERLLGQGGMAVVFLARDPLMKRAVAIKLLPRQWTFSADLRQRFNREAQIVASLEHPAIVPVYDFGEHDEQPYLVMRYMSGGSLRERMGQPLPLDEVVRILHRLGPALDEAHAQGIIHRDLKPDNVLFDEQNRPYLADFGIARIAAATQTLSLLGTPAYMAPEQAQGDATLDHRVDIYALGVMLYEMLSGVAPFQAETPPQLMYKHVYEAVPDIRLQRPDLPATVPTVISRAMAKEPEVRYPTVAALLDRLDEAAGDAPFAAAAPIVNQAPTVLEPALTGGARATPPPPIAPREDAIREPWLWRIPPAAGIALVVLLLLLICAAGVGGYQLVRGMLARPAAGEVDPVPPPPPVTASEAVAPAVIGNTATSSPKPTAATATRTMAPIVTHEPTRLETPTVPVETAGTEPPLAPSAGARWERPQDGMVMVFQPAGSFIMGSDPEFDDMAFDNEGPPHQVSMSPFWIDEMEVTNAQFAAFLNARGNQVEDEVTWLDVDDPDAEIVRSGNTFAALAGRADYPVVEVTWYGAVAYCRWAGATLPTEAQWEYAARGPDNLIFPWGNRFDGNRANHCDRSCEYNWREEAYDDGFAGAAPAGAFPSGASWSGAQDLAGNVWEWVTDWYDESYYAAAPATDPGGPSAGDSKVLRGGSWYNTPRTLRGADRLVDFPEESRPNYGFRCALPTAQGP